MNLIAITGAGALRGIAFLILHSVSEPNIPMPSNWISYEAYAPDPIVFDTSRNGNPVGNGATCDCMAIYISMQEMPKKP
jgi:hypothetical protein